MTFESNPRLIREEVGDDAICTACHEWFVVAVGRGSHTQDKHRGCLATCTTDIFLYPLPQNQGQGWQTKLMSKHDRIAWLRGRGNATSPLHTDCLDCIRFCIVSAVNVYTSTSTMARISCLTPSLNQSPQTLRSGTRSHFRFKLSRFGALHSQSLLLLALCPTLRKMSCL